MRGRACGGEGGAGCAVRGDGRHELEGERELAERQTGGDVARGHDGRKRARYAAVAPGQPAEGRDPGLERSHRPDEPGPQLQPAERADP